MAVFLVTFQHIKCVQRVANTRSVYFRWIGLETTEPRSYCFANKQLMENQHVGVDDEHDPRQLEDAYHL